MFGFGLPELVVIAIVALLFIGPDKLPETAKKISKGIREFRKTTRDLQKTIDEDTELGGAVRDLKSALRGDDFRPYRPPPHIKETPGEKKPDHEDDEDVARDPAASDDNETLDAPAEHRDREQVGPIIATPIDTVAKNELTPTPSDPTPDPTSNDDQRSTADDEHG